MSSSRWDDDTHTQAPWPQVHWDCSNFMQISYDTIRQQIRSSGLDRLVMGCMMSLVSPHLISLYWRRYTSLPPRVHLHAAGGLNVASTRRRMKAKTSVHLESELAICRTRGRAPSLFLPLSWSAFQIRSLAMHAKIFSDLENLEGWCSKQSFQSVQEDFKFKCWL